MRLNNECVRDLLLFLEESLDNKNDINIVGLVLDEYKSEDIIYTAQKLIEAGFLNGKPFYASEGLYYFPLRSITWDGHQFLDTIRPLTVWEITKEKAKVLGDTSITILSQIAVQVVANMMSTM